MAVSKFSATSSFPPPRNMATKRLNNARHLTLPYIVVLSLITLVLVTIYGACVSQSNHHRPSNTGQTSSPVTDTLSDPNSNHPASQPYKFARSPDFGHLPPAYFSPTVTNNTTSNSTTPTDDISASLFFYLALLPLLSLAHTLTESTILKFHPRLLSPTNVNSARLTFTNPLLLITSLFFLLPGWALMASFWTYCELSPAATSGVLTAAEMYICPAQVRAHFMYGISGVSIAKAAMAWSLVVGYAVHAAMLVRWWRVMRRWEALKRYGQEWGVGVEYEPEEKEMRRQASEEANSSATSPVIKGQGKVGGRVVNLAFPPPPTKPIW